ncbi:hypothetical protein A1507_12270 [Methylomonas koyamae]|uniref:Uncharacterized protein n=1 Tax=Methylomonas koyamae TaxID=702114 RepID=A0A177NG66_9GAMM|nr:hypothetical protein [Methylomonas koyamae]OAI16179.1 hypothetical protein A1507_12270 [Methylomonas koyamae]
MASTTIHSWHRIKLSSQEYQSGEIAVLMGAFRAAYVARNGPDGMAMFGHWTDDGSCYWVYTSPKSSRHIAPLLKAYSALRTPAPDPQQLSLIYGDESARNCFETGFEA